MLRFKEWMIKEGSEGSKTGLYPLGYGGVGLYPPQWYMTRSADAIFYVSIDERIPKNSDGGKFDITHIPGGPTKKANSGEGGMWDISHIKGKPSHLRRNSDYAANSGEGEPWSIKHLK
jgi:hypothetical protein